MACSDVIKKILQNDLKNKRRRNDKKLHHLKKMKRIIKVQKVNFFFHQFVVDMNQIF